jgi:corrinoid protein of di/trimethylamine methyltransferase
LSIEITGTAMHDLSAVREAILKGDADAAVAAARIALDGGVNPADLVRLAISPAMAEVGTKFEEGEGFVPELLVAARATKTVFQILRPLLAQSGTKSSGHVILGTVRGDLHDIGKNLVAAMLEGGGFEVTDLGVDVPPDKFVAAARDGRAHIVGLSALLTSTLPAMKTVVEAFCASGIRDSVRIMIGGAPATRAYADAIGADGYGESASAAVELARHLTGAQKTG